MRPLPAAVCSDSAVVVAGLPFSGTDGEIFTEKWANRRRSMRHKPRVAGNRAS